MANTMPKLGELKCRIGGEPLILGQNWTVSMKIHYRYICKTCQNTEDTKRRRQKGVKPYQPSKYGVPTKLPDGSKNPEYMRVWKRAHGAKERLDGWGNKEGRVCLDCGNKLIPYENWPKWLISRSTHLCKICYNKRDRLYREHRRRSKGTKPTVNKPNSVVKRCYTCKIELVPNTNWEPNAQIHHNYICKSCISQERKRQSKEYKIQAFELVGAGNMTCVANGCGCSDMRFLELNFKNGGHSMLIRAGKLPQGSNLYKAITLGRIDPNLFEIMCRPHNSIAHVESRAKIKLWNIKWTGATLDDSIKGPFERPIPSV